MGIPPNMQTNTYTY